MTLTQRAGIAAGMALMIGGAGYGLAVDLMAYEEPAGCAAVQTPELRYSCTGLDAQGVPTINFGVNASIK